MATYEQQVRDRVFEDDRALFDYISKASVVPVQIHVVGTEDDPQILVTPSSAEAKQFVDDIVWSAGGNCGAWKVTFDKGDDSPLEPAGPYESSGPTGGQVTGDPDKYRYSVEAVDLRTGNKVKRDPDVVVVA